ncbi:unnamed protein product [Prunus armeniaca]|uniref:F-box associated domain-containing protein n=1 Tax=Prunus armeniaca TaxID=36596 RepID=A0A6J5VYS6_PRUAR|nr:unnamed protein product [Prunus armeniaca]CAB4294356.1 unnamed protein product [Prunus armeniaca]
MDREPTSMAANQEEARCVYLYVFGDEGEYTNAIYEVKFKHEVPRVVELVAKFYEGRDYCFEAARIFNCSILYCRKRDGGYIIDTNTRARSSSVPPTLASKPTLTLVSASSKLYCLVISWSYPWSYKPILEPSFERCDLDENIWEQMSYFPFYNDYHTSMEITDYAISYGVIFFRCYVVTEVMSMLLLS